MLHFLKDKEGDTMIDPQGSHKRWHSLSRFSPVLFFFVMVFVLVVLDSRMIYPRFSALGPILGQLAVNSLFALLTQMRQYRIVTCIARIVVGVWMLTLLISYCMPVTIFKLDDGLERIVTTTCVMIGMWHSFIAIVGSSQLEDTTYFIARTASGKLYGIKFPDGCQGKLEVFGRQILAFRIIPPDYGRKKITDPYISVIRDPISGGLAVKRCEIPSEKVRSYLNYLMKHNHGESWTQDLPSYMALFKEEGFMFL
jgi:hypothetical protein